MKKNYSLSEQYEFSLKTISIGMPLAAIFLIVIGIVCCILEQVTTWVGILLIALGVGVVLMYVFLRKFMLKRIDELKQQEQNNGD